MKIPFSNLQYISQIWNQKLYYMMLKVDIMQMIFSSAQKTGVLPVYQLAVYNLEITDIKN